MNAEEAKSTIETLIKDNDLFVFMKGSADFPQCGFSGQVIQILRHFGREPATYDVLSNDAIRQGIKDFSNWPTIPQIYVKGEFIGGCDILTEMAQSGDLPKMLEEKLGAPPQ